MQGMTKTQLLDKLNLFLAAHMERSLVITRKLVSRFAPGCFRRMVPYAMLTLILLFVLCSMVYRSLTH